MSAGRLLQRGLPLLLAVALASCAGPQIFHPQLSSLDKGMAPSEVMARLQQPPLSSHSASAGGREFDFQRYRMNNGMHTDLYLLAYEQGRLLFWGYLSEFRRLSDADLNRALNQALQQADSSASRAQ